MQQQKAAAPTESTPEIAAKAQSNGNGNGNGKSSNGAAPAANGNAADETEKPATDKKKH